MSTNRSIEQKTTIVKRTTSRQKGVKKGKLAVEPEVSSSPMLCCRNMILQPLPPTIENWEACQWIARIAKQNIRKK